MQPRNTTGESFSFYCWDGEVLVVNILGKPGAKKDAIGEPLANQLRVSVKAPPLNGRATDAMVAFLARPFGGREANIAVVYGRESVNKQLRIRAPRTLPEVFARFAPGGGSASR